MSTDWPVVKTPGIQKLLCLVLVWSRISSSPTEGPMSWEISNLVTVDYVTLKSSYCFVGWTSCSKARCRVPLKNRVVPHTRGSRIPMVDAWRRDEEWKRARVVNSAYCFFFFPFSYLLLSIFVMIWMSHDLRMCTNIMIDKVNSWD